jgi:hypothetical protein
LLDFYVDERQKLLDSTTQEGVKLHSQLVESADWLKTVKDGLDKLEPVSCRKEKLVQQCRDNEVRDLYVRRSCINGKLAVNIRVYDAVLFKI